MFIILKINFNKAEPGNTMPQASQLKQSGTEKMSIEGSHRSNSCCRMSVENTKSNKV